DKVLTNRILGLPIFLVLMWLLFNFVFTFGAYPQEWIENGVGLFGDFVGSHMADGDLKSLIVDGIIGGVGGVITFLPNIVLLFLGIAILEDSGYMARAAFVMDRVMRFAGLHGKSFIPMLMGFGCAVPAIMGTRTLENPRDRMVTIFVIPLMSCGARLPVYTLLISAFFAPDVAGTVLFSIYVLGIVLAVIAAFIIRGTMFKGDTEPFVMELPPYHMPALRSVLMHMWERAVLYLKKAGTIILAVSIIVWFLTSYPSDVDFTKDYEGLTAAADTAFTETVDEKVFAPLVAEMLVAENTEEQSTLEALTAEVDAVYAEFEEQTAELEEGSAELAALTTSKDEKLKQLETENEKLYPLVAAFMDEKDKIKEVSEQIAALDTQFEEESEELEEGSAEFLALEAEKDAKLTELEAENQKLYPLAVEYHELQAERDEQIAELEHQQASEQIAGSYAGRLGKMIEPVIAPLGFDWKIGIALITGFAAKEVVVSTLGTIYSIGEADETSTTLKAMLLADPTFSPLVAYTLMVFVLIYVPCLAALAVIKRETNSWKWTAFVTVYTTALAWIVSFIIYHGGQALGF
ncbi:MAG: ferrous iron transport protein B, partial [Sporomusa sp.]